jgi:diguanylate cyclase (GGDEF)-like protein
LFEVFTIAWWLITLSSLPLGITLGWWLCCNARRAVARQEAAVPACVTGGEPYVVDASGGLDIDKAQEVLASFCQVSHGLHKDVGSHHAKIEAVSEALAKLGVNNEPQNVTVKRAVKSILDANAWLQGQLASAQDVIQDQATELERQFREANTDALTGIANRRAFDHELGRCFANWRRFGDTFCLLLLDIDRFKQLNDKYGHPAGDAVLQSIARAINRSVREVDLGARWGGEEFAVLLPKTCVDEAYVVAERIRATVEEARVVCGGAAVSATVSIGVGMALAGDEPATLVQRTDEALYNSKKRGRNRTTLQSTSSEAASSLASSSGGENERMVSEREPTILDRPAFCEQIRLRLEERRKNDGPWVVLIGELRRENAQDSEDDQRQDLVEASLPGCAAGALPKSALVGVYGSRSIGVLLCTTELRPALQHAKAMRNAVINSGLLSDDSLDGPATFAVAAVAVEPNEGWVALLKRAESILRFARAANGNAVYAQARSIDPPIAVDEAAVAAR